jgi:transcriptional regulator with XRE-family HTH domain
MSIGKKVLQLRLQSKMTQQEISEVTGLAVSYLSRLENERITPSIKTLTRIADAFGVPVTRLLEGEPRTRESEHCPVSPSGHCLLTQLSVGRGRRPKIEGESYSPFQLEILRMCNLLLQTQDREIVESLSTVLKSLVALAGSRQEKVPLH